MTNLVWFWRTKYMGQENYCYNAMLKLYSEFVKSVWKLFYVCIIQQTWNYIKNGGGGGGIELLTCPYPLKVQACPRRDQRPALWAEGLCVNENNLMGRPMALDKLASIHCVYHWLDILLPLLSRYTQLIDLFSINPCFSNYIPRP